MDHNKLKYIPGPENITRRVLPNGVRILLWKNPWSRSAQVRVSLPTGNYLNPAGKNSLADYTAAMLMNGTERHDFHKIHEMLEYSGASMNFSAYTANLTGSVNCLSEDLPAMLELLKEVLDKPVFPSEYVELVRQKVLTSYRLAMQDPETLADEAFDHLLYGDTPYGIPSFGSEEVIRGITREDLVEFHRRYYGPAGMVIAIAGGIDISAAAELCERIFGTWQTSQQVVDTAACFPDVPKPDREIREHIEIPEKSEMELVIGTMGPKRGDPEFTAAQIGNSIFGEFGMMGRIGEIVREENGLAYDIGSSLDSLKYGGSWSVDAGINPANLEKTTDLILREFRRFTTEKVTEEELDDVKSYALGTLPFSFETNAGVASILTRIETYDLGLDHLLRAPDRIHSVTADAILAAARKWLDPEKMVIISAGTSAK